MAEQKLLRFWEIKEISEEELVGDRGLQWNIFQTLRNSSHDKDYVQKKLENNPDLLYQHNPNPIVHLDRFGSGCSQDYYTFRIDDENHIYFFPSWSSGDQEVIDKYLRPEDIAIGEGIDSPFTKYLLRVENEYGNGPRLYSQRDSEWVVPPFGLGIHQPTISNTFKSPL